MEKVLNNVTSYLGSVILCVDVMYVLTCSHV